jgi:hypothetical protein
LDDISFMKIYFKNYFKEFNNYITLFFDD